MIIGVSSSFEFQSRVIMNCINERGVGARNLLFPSTHEQIPRYAVMSNPMDSKLVCAT